jgi:hypothetical protein
MWASRSSSVNPVGGAGAVGAHHDRSGRVHLPELLERQIEHPQMV